MTDPAEYGSPTDDEIRDLTRGMPPALVKRFQVVATTMMMTKEHFNDRTPWRHLVDVFAKFPARWEKVDIIDSRGEHVTIEAYVNRGVGKHGFHSALVEPSLALADLLEEIEKERVRNKENGRAGGRPPTRQDELRQSLERAIEKHGIKKMMEQHISWIVRVASSNASSKLPADGQQADSNAPSPNPTPNPTPTSEEPKGSAGSKLPPCPTQTVTYVEINDIARSHDFSQRNLKMKVDRLIAHYKSRKLLEASNKIGELALERTPIRERIDQAQALLAGLGDEADADDWVR